MSRSSAAPEMISLSFLLYISLISGNLVPSSSIFLPISGLGTKLEIWSVISMKSPALKPAFTPPDAFVRKSTFAPNILISLAGSTTSSIAYPS